MDNTNYRPYWKRHPVQRRIASALLLMILPAIYLVALVLDNWDDLKADFKGLAAIAFLPSED
jgi:hypothetical protein